MNLVLSYGDLSHPGGYRTRILGELQWFDGAMGNNPFLLVFDRNPAEFRRSLDIDTPHRVIPRSAVLKFHSVIAQITREHDVKLVHAHNLYSTAMALSCRHKYGYKVVLDYHGRIPEEYVFLGKGGAISRRVLEALEHWCVNRADHIIVVSEKLLEYLVGRYRISAEKISVIPCCTDPGIFNWKADRRAAVRSSLNLEDRFVCTHLGSFSAWYAPDLLLNAFHQVLAVTDAHLMVVTQDTGTASEYLISRLPRERFTVLSAGRDDIPGLLNASDLGLLLLRQSANIQTCSPVKFAEYLNCGLPVLISAAVGDYSRLSQARHVGTIVGQDGSFDETVLNGIRAQRDKVALHCQAVGRDLTWGAFRDTWSRMLSGLQQATSALAAHTNLREPS